MSPGPNPHKTRIVTVLCLLLGISLAGCFGGDDEGNGDDPTVVDPPVDPGPPMLGVALADAPQRVVIGQGVGLNVSITGDSANASWIGVRMSFESTAGLDNLTAEGFDRFVEVDVQPLTTPGTYPVDDWAPSQNRTHYLRAHVVANETDYWGDEVVVDVVNVVEWGGFDADQVITINPVGPVASYDPDPAQISVGQAVSWSNTDLVAHTATNDDHWDTQEIDPGESSLSYRFWLPGTYEVHCTIHSGMSAEIEVS